MTHSDTVWWHIYPMRACGAPASQGLDQAVEHRIGRLTQPDRSWLDHVVDLGCSGLLMGPIFSSMSHGYDTLDHFRIDPRLGDDADFDALMAAAAARGLPVLLDGVFNHVSRQHPIVQRALAQGPNGPDAGWVSWTDDGRVQGWEGHDELVTLNHGDPRVADFVVEVMVHWLRRGIAGWRLDVAYAVPASFWHEVVDRVRSEFGEAMFLGEMIHGDYSDFVAASGLTTVTQYELWKAIGNSLHETNLWELAWSLDRHAQFCRAMTPNTFVGNHDVSRIASVDGVERAGLALVILMTVPGMPSLDDGDEAGVLGEKGEGMDADLPLRPELPSSPGEWEGGPLFGLHQQMIRLRRANPWLTRGTIEVVDKDNTRIHYRVTGEGHRGDIEIELNPTAARVVIDGTQWFAVDAAQLG